MSQNNSADNGHGQVDQKVKGRIRFSRVGRVALLVLVALVVIGGLISASFYFKDASDRVKFLTESILSASILTVIVVQTIIYYQQRRIMQQQKDLSAIAGRAYLGIKGVGIVNPVVQSTMVIYAVFFNGGQTPAWNVET